MTETARDYEMTRDGWADGSWRRAGERLRLTPRAARHEPLLRQVEEAPRRTRRRKAAATAAPEPETPDEAGA